MLECTLSLWSGLAVKGGGVGMGRRREARECLFLYLLVYKYEMEGKRCRNVGKQ